MVAGPYRKDPTMNRRHRAARHLLTALTALGVTAGLLLSGAPAASATPCTGPTVAAT